jgi:hypothetical protein
MKTVQVLLLGLAVSFTGICKDNKDNGQKEFQVEFMEAGEKVKAKMRLADDQLQIVEGKYDERVSFSIPRRGIRKVQDSAGLITFHLSAPFTYRTTSRSSFTVKMDPEQSHKVVTWYGQPGFANTDDATRHGVGTIVREEVSMTVEHRHPVAPNCKGRLIAGPDALRYESSTMPEHSRTWNYGDVQKFDRIASANEVVLKAHGSDDHVFTGMREGSDAAIRNIVSSRMTTKSSNK